MNGTTEGEAWPINDSRAIVRVLSMASELRLNSKGLLDDVVVEGVTLVRLEHMGPSTWWLGLYQGDVRLCIWIYGDKADIVENDLNVPIVTP